MAINGTPGQDNTAKEQSENIDESKTGLASNTGEQNNYTKTSTEQNALFF